MRRRCANDLPLLQNETTNYYFNKQQHWQRNILPMSRRFNLLPFGNHSTSSRALMTTKTRMLILILSLFILLYALLLHTADVKKIVWLAGRNINMQQKKIKPVRISYIIPPDVVVNASSSNELLATFEKVMSSPDLTLHPNHDAYIPLLIDVYNDRSIKCRGSHLI